MTIELIAIIALAGLMIGLFRWLKQDIRDLNNRMDTPTNRVDTTASDTRSAKYGTDSRTLKD